jgi:hypothetical protein
LLNGEASQLNKLQPAHVWQMVSALIRARALQVTTTMSENVERYDFRGLHSKSAEICWAIAVSRWVGWSIRAKGLELRAKSVDGYD